MIKPNELRVGNYVTDKSNQILEVDSIVRYVKEPDNAEVSMLLNGKDAGEYNVKHICPIPLTDEWLLKAGFWHLEYRFKWQKDGFYFQLEEPENDDLSDGYGLLNFNLDASLKRIKYVHELQNLYHALTGEELQINL